MAEADSPAVVGIRRLGRHLHGKESWWLAWSFAWGLGTHGTSWTHSRISTSRLRKLRNPRSDRSASGDQEKHRGIWRRSRKRYDLGTFRRWNESMRADGVASRA